MTLSVSGVGHLVLYVRDLRRAASFYCGVLGLRPVAEGDFGEGPMLFLSTGHSHHDLALIETGAATGAPAIDRGALHHFALRIGDHLDQLRDAKLHLAQNGVPVQWALDHRVSQGIYLTDPDGNLIELYVDADPLVWRTDPTQVATSEPLAL